jgi:two-component system, LytTR family, sensor kinase
MLNYSYSTKEIRQNKWVLIIGISIITFGAPFIFNNYKTSLFSTQSLLSVAGSLLTTLIMWFGTMTIVKYLWENYPWEKNPLKHLIIEIISILAYTSAVIAIFYTINELHPIESFEENLKLSIFFTLLITFFITSLTEGYFFFIKWKETRVLSENLEKENIKSQYETLKSQINPHFLFNNLNTLASLIEENPKHAVEYVQQTADYYRSILNLKDKEVISLAEEIELIKTFYTLQQNRYGDNLKLNIKIPDDITNSMVAPLVLQMLVENAIKHNIISKDKPLTIDIYTMDSKVIVRNNLQKRDQEQASTQFGLKNIIDRYSFLSNRKVEILENDSTFTVSIPILTM